MLMTPMLMTPDQVAAALGIHRSTLYRWWRQGRGPRFVRIGPGLRRCDPADVAAFGWSPK
jgi:excisionase family DNA binding protein